MRTPERYDIIIADANPSRHGGQLGAIYGRILPTLPPETQERRLHSPVDPPAWAGRSRLRDALANISRGFSPTRPCG